MEHVKTCKLRWDDIIEKYGDLTVDDFIKLLERREETIKELENDKIELQKMVAELKRWVESIHGENERLTKRNERLTKRNERLEKRVTELVKSVEEKEEVLEKFRNDYTRLLDKNLELENELDSKNEQSGEYRPCIIKTTGKRVLFRRWVEEIGMTLALIEFENGHTAKVNPKNLQFLNSRDRFVEDCRNAAEILRLQFEDLKHEIETEETISRFINRT